MGRRADEPGWGNFAIALKLSTVRACALVSVLTPERERADGAPNHGYQHGVWLVLAHDAAGTRILARAITTTCSLSHSLMRHMMRALVWFILLF